MTADQIGGAVRAALGVLVGYLAGKGIISAGMGADIVAVASAAIIGGWSAWTNRPSKIAK